VAKPIDLDRRMLLAAGLLFTVGILLNGFPFLINDSPRYVGADYGSANAPVLLTFLSRPLFTLFGVWGTSILNISITSYALARLATLEFVSSSRALVLVSAVLSQLFIFAGLVGSEVWLFCTVIILACLALGRPWNVFDILIVAAGAVVHNGNPPVVLGLLILGLVMQPARWRLWLLLLAAIVLTAAANDRVFSTFHKNAAPLRYSFAAAEWMTRSPDLLVDFCRESPREKICQEPYYSFLLSFKNTRLEDNRYFWGPSSLFRGDSALPEDKRFRWREFEATSKKIFFYGMLHPWHVIPPVLQKIAYYWDGILPGIWVDEGAAERMATRFNYDYRSYQRSLQAAGLFSGTDSGKDYAVFNLLIFHIAVALYLPALAWFAARRNRQAVLWAVFVGAAMILNLCMVATFSVVTGRYIFKLLFIPVFFVGAMFADICVVALGEARRRGWAGAIFNRNAG
jgi:hypothetical protein